MLVSSSEVILTSQLRVWVTCNAPDMREDCLYTVVTVPYYHNQNPYDVSNTINIIIICSVYDKNVSVSATDIEGVGYRQANHATVQSLSGNNSKQSSKKYHQGSQGLQTDG